MKKVFSIVLAAMMVALLCVSASAAQNTNHIFDFSELTEDESAYVIGGWTCVDTTGLTALGYQLDGGDTVWAVTKCDEVRADNTASVKGENSCYRDTNLEGALLQGGGLRAGGGFVPPVPAGERGIRRLRPDCLRRGAGGVRPLRIQAEGTAPPGEVLRSGGIRDGGGCLAGGPVLRREQPWSETSIVRP